MIETDHSDDLPTARLLYSNLAETERSLTFVVRLVHHFVLAALLRAYVSPLHTLTS
jgi:hypothetical protein